MDVRDLEKKYRNQIRRVLNKNSHHITSLVESTYEQDTREAFDAIYSFNDSKIPIRIRKNTYVKYRDFTIRSKAMNGGKTEIDKILSGFGDYYFYAWENVYCTSFFCYMIVDLKMFRDSGLITNKYQLRKNSDGTEFYVYSINDLVLADCLNVYEKL